MKPDDGLATDVGDRMGLEDLTQRTENLCVYQLWTRTMHRDLRIASTASHAKITRGVWARIPSVESADITLTPSFVLIGLA